MKAFDQNLSDTVLHGKKEIDRPDLRQFKFWGLYFSASWCPPCRQFTQMLTNFYENQKHQFQIILVTHDENERDFLNYYAKMPWLAIPWKERLVMGQLVRLCRPQTIPHLCIFDSEGHYVTCNATDHVARHGNRAWQIWEEIAQEKQRVREQK